MPAFSNPSHTSHTCCEPLTPEQIQNENKIGIYVVVGTVIFIIAIWFLVKYHYDRM